MLYFELRVGRHVCGSILTISSETNLREAAEHRSLLGTGCHVAGWFWVSTRKHVLSAGKALTLGVGCSFIVWVARVCKLLEVVRVLAIAANTILARSSTGARLLRLLEAVRRLARHRSVARFLGKLGSR